MANTHISTAFYLKLVLIPPIVIAVILYLSLLLFLYLNQRTLIFPGSLAQGTKRTMMIPLDNGGEFVSLKTASGTMLTGYYTPSDSHNNPQKQTILFFYGNGSCANDCWDIVREFQSMGCSVMLVDYPGFGMSKGKASDTGCYDAAEAAYKYLTHTRGISDEKIIIAGWSLGSSVAIHLASQHVCAGLMTFSAFTNMTEMASHEYPVVPEWISSILLKYRFPSIEMISHVRCPTLIAHGSLDRYVPTYMADKLAAADHGQVTRVTVAGAGHNDILSNKNAKLYREIAVWLGRIPDTAAAH